MLEEKLLTTIRKYSLILPQENVLVALSGGPDSVALLHLLLKVKDKLGIKLFAAHVNHMLRGKESTRDEEFVKKLCSEWKIPLFTKRINVPKISKGKNVEAVARKLRYQFLEETLRSLGRGKIATGHTASDLTETVLLNLTKGTGIKGLRGFLPKRGNVVRPLFEITRSEIEKYLEKENLPYVIDSSNLSTDYERNLIRHKVVSELKKINPSLEKAFLRNCETVRLLEDFIEKETDCILKNWIKKEKLEIPIDEFSKLHPFLKRQLLQKGFHLLTGKSLSFKNVLELEKLTEKEGHKEIHLGEGFKGVKEGEFLLIKRDEKVKDFCFKITKLPARINTPVGTLIFEKNEGEPIINLEEFEKEGLVVRNRREGDKLNFGKYHKSLKKFLIEKKVPHSLRWKLPLLIHGGEIIYIPNLFRAYIKPSGKPFVGLRIEKSEN